jgi:hypothetical protein
MRTSDKYPVVNCLGGLTDAAALAVCCECRKAGRDLLTMSSARMVVFTNANLGQPWMLSAVMYRIFDAFLGNPAKDWNAE